MRALREKIQVAYKEKHIRIRADFSMETLKTRRIWSSALQILKDYKGQLRLIYLDKQSAIIDEKGKTLLHIKSLKNICIQQMKPEENTGMSKTERLWIERRKS